VIIIQTQKHPLAENNKNRLFCKKIVNTNLEDCNKTPTSNSVNWQWFWWSE